MSKPVNIKIIVGLTVLLIVLFISGYYVNKMSNREDAFLHAFVVANIGLMQQKKNIEHKNASIIDEFYNQVTISKNSPKIVGFRDQAIEVCKLSNELNDYIEQMKIDLVAYTDGCSPDKAKKRVLHPFQVRRKSDYVKTTRWFGTSEDIGNGSGNIGKAHDLKLKLETYRVGLIEYIKTPNTLCKNALIKNLENLNLDVPIVNRNQEYHTGWEMFFFYKLPLSAALTELTKWQNNVLDAESTVLTYLYDQISASSFKFDAVLAAITPKSYVVTSGSNFEAEVFLSAFSSAVKPKIVYGTTVDSVTGEVRGGIQLTHDKFTHDGRGHISIPTSGSGERTCAGIIVMTHPVTGAEQKYSFRTKYTVTPR